MNILIAYASQHGCTETCSDKLKRLLKGRVTLINLKKEKAGDLKAFDQIVIGGSIHAGKIQKTVRTFCRTHQQTLLSKSLGLFLCCMDADKARAQFEAGFDAVLRSHAAATGLFGGAFDLERMNFMEKAIVRKVAGITASVSEIKDDAIEAFADRMNQASAS